MMTPTANGNLNKVEDDEKFIVQYKNDFYDITEFSHKHPGRCNFRKTRQIFTIILDLFRRYKHTKRPQWPAHG